MPVFPKLPKDLLTEDLVFLAYMAVDNYYFLDSEFIAGSALLAWLHDPSVQIDPSEEKPSFDTGMSLDGYLCLWLNDNADRLVKISPINAPFFQAIQEIAEEIREENDIEKGAYTHVKP